MNSEISKLLSLLCDKQFRFEATKGSEVESKVYKELLKIVPVIEISNQVWYRARNILPKDGEETGIKRIEGVPVQGYNETYSGIAPASSICKSGRINHNNEQILYLAEDKRTAILEVKPEIDTYLSVAECKLENAMRLIDFSLLSRDAVRAAFSEKMREDFSDKYGACPTELYVACQKYLTFPEEKELEYIISRTLIELIKKDKQLSGIKYVSFFTNKSNIALWDSNRNLKCRNSKVEQYVVE